MDQGSKNNSAGNADLTAKFWSSIPDALHEEQSLFYVVDTYIHSFRSTLDEHTRTAQSIDRREPWSSIKGYAREEGFESFAGAVEFIDSVLDDWPELLKKC